jgi:hypothetical protein
MANSIKDTLHELIKYLSKSEKRYFKVYSSKHIIGSENNYNVLFDFIDKQRVYDEDEIFKFFKGELFLNRFSITKKRLYDYIISALDNFHSTNLIDSQIYKHLSAAEILYKKSLYHQSLKQLNCAENVALKHNKFNLLSEINYKKKQIYESQGLLDLKTVTKMLEEDQEYHLKSLTYDKLWNLKSQLFSVLNLKGTSRSEEDILQFKSILDELLKSTIKSELYFDSKYLYNHIYSAYYFAINSLDECYLYLMENLCLLENNLMELIEKPNRYLSVLTNAIFIAFNLNRKEDLLDLQKKLMVFQKNETLSSNEDLKIKLFSSTYSLELTLLLLTGNINVAKEKIPLIEEGLEKYKDKITETRKAFFYLKITTVYLYNEEYSNALKSINQIIHNNLIDKQEELISIAHLVNLLIHFEIKNDKLLAYSLKNTQRYLKTRNRLFDFEKTFLKFISKMTKTENIFEKEELWFDLYEELKTIKENSFQRVAFEYFDFINWAKAKSERKSICEFLKKIN